MFEIFIATLGCVILWFLFCKMLFLAISNKSFPILLERTRREFLLWSCPFLLFVVESSNVTLIPKFCVLFCFPFVPFLLRTFVFLPFL